MGDQLARRRSKSPIAPSALVGAGGRPRGPARRRRERPRRPTWRVDTEGHTTLEQILSGHQPGRRLHDAGGGAGQRGLRRPRSRRRPAKSGRGQRRRSLAYFSQLTDFQLADEESPARVEFLDQVAGQGGATSAWRPWEALTPFMIDDSIRQINRFVAHSPVPQGNGVGQPDGPGADHGRPGRQPAAQRDDLDAGAPGGRGDDQLQLRPHRPRRLLAGEPPQRQLPGVRHAGGRAEPRPPPRPPGTRASRTTPTTRRARRPARTRSSMTRTSPPATGPRGPSTRGSWTAPRCSPSHRPA